MHPEQALPPQNPTAPRPEHLYPAYLNYESYRPSAPQLLHPTLLAPALPTPALTTSAGTVTRNDGVSPSCDPQSPAQPAAEEAHAPSHSSHDSHSSQLKPALVEASALSPSPIPSFPPSTPPLPLSALAAILGCTRSTIRHFADRLGYRFTVRHIGPRQKRTACLTPGQANAIAQAHAEDIAAHPPITRLEPPKKASDVGLFYLLQLEPKKDPTRIKLGFTTDLDSRLDDLQTAAPFARCIAIWPARRSWERMAIVATSQVATQIRQEVYDCQNIQSAIAAANAFFASLPKLQLPDELRNHHHQPPDEEDAPRSCVVPTPTNTTAEGSSHPSAQRAAPPPADDPPPTAHHTPPAPRSQVELGPALGTEVLLRMESRAQRDGSRATGGIIVSAGGPLSHGGAQHHAPIIPILPMTPITNAPPG